MTTFDNRDVLSLAGKILERLGDKSLDLPKESLEKVLQNLNTALNTLNESSAAVPQSASVEQRGEPCRPVETTPVAVPDDPHSTHTQNAFCNGIPETSDNTFSDELLQHIDDIRSDRVPPRAISDRLKVYISSGDVNRCIGHLVNEDLWNGNLGWRSAVDFYAGISYIWTHAKNIFQPFDKFREITETKSNWNQQYFDTQRNYLRHNFSLERLCHLVMVYDYLHGKQANRASSSSPQSQITVITEKKSPFGSDSANVSTTSTSLQSRKNRFYICIGGFIVLLVIVGMSMCKPKSDDSSEGKSLSSLTKNQKQTATTSSDLNKKSNDQSTARQKTSATTSSDLNKKSSNQSAKPKTSATALSDLHKKSNDQSAKPKTSATTSGKEERMEIKGRKIQIPAEGGKTHAPAKENGSEKK